MASEFDQTIQHSYIITETGLVELEANLARVENRIQSIGRASQQSQAGLNSVLPALDKISKYGIGLARSGAGLAQIGRVFGSSAVTELGRYAVELGVVVGSLDDAYKTLKGIGATGGLAKLLGAGGAVAGGIGLGAAIFDVIRPPGSDDAGTVVEKGVASLQYGLTALFEGTDKAGQSFQETAENFGLVEKAADRAGPALGVFVQSLRGVIDGVAEGISKSVDARDAYIDFQRDLSDAEKSGGERRVGILKDATERLADVERAAMERREQIIDKFVEDDNRAQENYYADRASRARDFGEEMSRLEEDHQRNIRRMTEDSRLRQLDLISGRDALGLARERRNAELQRRRAEEDYQVQTGRRNADFARQMADQESSFAAQRNRRLSDYEQSIKELNANLIEQRRTIQIDAVKRISELNSQLREERQRIRDSFEGRLIDLGYFTAAQEQMYNAWLGQMTTDFVSWIATNPIDFRRALPGFTPQPTSSPEEDYRPGPGRPYAQGGYTSSGLAMLHANEFVLSRSATRAAEGALGMPLTQQGIVATLRGQGGGITMNFYGSWTEGDKTWFREEIRNGSIRTYAEINR